MKKQFRRIALGVMFVMAVSLVAPAARVAEAATTKIFTYAEQTTNDPVSKLVMSEGESVDIKFAGISDAQNYTCTWGSNNTKVATVSTAGVIKAVGKGVATVQCRVTGGDGTVKYVSSGITVYVDSYKQEVTIGTAAQEEIKSYTIKMGTQATLKANGMMDCAGDRYEYNWSSTDTTVATISKNGTITPVKPGLTVIQLTVKKLSNGEEYEATPIALQITEQPKRFTVTFVNNFYDNDTLVGTTTSKYSYDEGYKYNFSTSSTSRYHYNNVAGYYCKDVTVTGGVGLNASELTVSGIIGGDATITRKMVRVVATPKPVATATPKPVATATPKPVATATPKPVATATPKPVATATPKPVATATPIPVAVSYTTTIKSDKELLLTFNQPVDYSTTDIQLSRLLVFGNQIIPLNCEIANVTADSTGTQLSVVPTNAFVNGERYMIIVGSEDTGTTFNVVLGAPNRIEITYKCMGTENAAYAYDMYSTVDVPVELSYRLYYGNIDVTETYSNRGYITYGFAANKYYENVVLGDKKVYFYAENVSAVITGTFSYYDDKGTLKELNGAVSMTSRRLPAYSITDDVKFTIIDGSALNTEKIDWNTPNKQIIADTRNAKVVAMISDSYGNRYVTDERGVDTANKIYYINDYQQMFARLGYSVKFSEADSNKIAVASDGTIFPFQASNNVTILLTLTNNGQSGYGNSTSEIIGAYQINVLEQSKLVSVMAETTAVKLTTDALFGFERRFCETDIELILKDQYRDEWEGHCHFTLSSSIPELKNAFDGSSLAPATISGTTLHINAKNIKALTNITSVPIVITESTTKLTVVVNVTLVPPVTTYGEITVTGCKIGVQKPIVYLGQMTETGWAENAVIEVLKTSGSVEVGLFNNLRILETRNHVFTPSSCTADQIYLLVVDPDGNVVPQAAHSNALGVYVDTANGCIKVNVSAPAESGNVHETLPAGQYTVTATRILSVGTTVQKAVLPTITFSVIDNTKDIAFRAVTNSTTPLTVSGNDDLAGIKEIVVQNLTFNLDGKPWNGITTSMITDVDFIKNGDTIYIRSVEFAIPFDSNNPFGMAYRKSCTVGKTIKTGVTQ